MAWMHVYGACVICRRPFHFNPTHVPSVRVRGEREPVCQDCMSRANAQRQAKGLPPLAIHPDAYEPEECP